MINREEFEALYYDGLSPRQIAELLGVKYQNIQKYMRDRGYPRVCAKNEQSIRDMCKTGAKDIEIAMATNLTITQVREWLDNHGITRRDYTNRKKSKQPSQRKITIKNSHIMKYNELYALGYNDVLISIAVGVTSQSVWSWRQRNNLPKNTNR